MKQRIVLVRRREVDSPLIPVSSVRMCGTCFDSKTVYQLIALYTDLPLQCPILSVVVGRKGAHMGTVINFWFALQTHSHSCSPPVGHLGGPPGG